MTRDSNAAGTIADAIRRVAQPMEKIKKLDAARRQLSTAIELWFHDADSVSIHTLACAAHQIIHDLNKRQKGRDLLFDSIVIKDEYRREYIALIKEPSNFFKHADRGKTGSAKSIYFSPGVNDIFILMSIMGVQYLREPLNDNEVAFFNWYAFNNPEFLTEFGRKQYVDSVPVEKIAEIRDIPKSDFFKGFVGLRQAARR